MTKVRGLTVVAGLVVGMLLTKVVSSFTAGVSPGEVVVIVVLSVLLGLVILAYLGERLRRAGRRDAIHS